MGKRILIVDFNGTSSIYTHYFANGLKSETNQVKILGKRKSEFLEVFNDNSKYLGFNLKFKLLNYFLNWFWLFYHKNKFDVIIIQWLQLIKYSTIEVYLTKKLQSKSKVIYIAHNVYPHRVTSARVIKNYNLLYNSVKNIGFHTSEVKNKILTISASPNFLKISHGLFFRNMNKGEFSKKGNFCLMVGYVAKYKGVEDAIKIVKILKDLKQDIRLEIVGLGDPKYIYKLNRLIQQKQLQHEIRITSKEVSTGFLIKKIQQSKMLWLPYQNISQSGVTYTSIGLKKTFVAYDVGNFKEEFGNKGMAKIVKFRDLNSFALGVIEVQLNEMKYLNKIEENYHRFNWELNKSIL